MCVICRGEYHGKTYIRSSNCPLLREIPVIPGLQILVYYCCPLLEKIAVIPGLQRLECWGCFLREIPVIPGLQRLYLESCPLLEKIPVIPGLQILYLDACPLLTAIPVIPGLQELHFSNCPWVNPSTEKLALLIFLQRKVKKIFAKKKKIIGCPSYLLSTLEKY
jgi:hypothetical protein